MKANNELKNWNPLSFKEWNSYFQELAKCYGFTGFGSKAVGAGVEPKFPYDWKKEGLLNKIDS